jgi:uncharacterized membrane protein YkgB
MPVARGGCAMNNRKNPIATFAYVIIGLIVLIVGLQILGGVLRLLSGIVSAVLTLLLALAVVYMVYLAFKWAVKNIQ